MENTYMHARYPDLLLIKLAAMYLMTRHETVSPGQLSRYLAKKDYLLYPVDIDDLMDWLSRQEAWSAYGHGNRRFYSLGYSTSHGVPCERLGFSVN